MEPRNTQKTRNIKHDNPFVLFVYFVVEKERGMA